MPPSHENHNNNYLDLAVLWIATAIGQLTLEKWVLLATLVYTVLRVVVLIRNDILKKDKKD